MGKSGQAILNALCAGESDPARLAQHLPSNCQAGFEEARSALTGDARDHHRVLLQELLSLINAQSLSIKHVEQEIERRVSPFEGEITRCEQITGVSRQVVHVLMAEIGTDLARFPDAAHLSLASSFQRGWGSVYDALVDGQIDAQAVESLLAQYPLEGEEAIYAVDASVWALCDAETSPERAFYHHPSRDSAGQPIVAGWACHWIAQVSFAHDSWTDPRKIRRLKPGENINHVAVEQIKELLQDTPDAPPLCPFLSSTPAYAPGQLALAWGSLHAAALTRLRSGRCFSTDPSEVAPTGRSPRHGHTFACADSTTWLEPDQEYATENTQYGRVRVRAWHQLHAVPQNHSKRGTRGPRPLIRGTLILVEVAQLPKHTRVPNQLWLWWHAPELPTLPLVWRARRLLASCWSTPFAS